MKTYICSDLHYNHKNLVTGTCSWDDKSICRDFSTLEDHNAFVVDEINSKVDTDDTLYCLGDWSFGGIEKIWEFRKQLKVKTIHLVLGNHDHHIENDKKILPNCRRQYPYAPFPFIDEKPEGGEYPDYVYTRELFTTVQHYLEVPIPNIKDRKAILMHYPLESWNGMQKGNIHFFGHQHSDRIGSGRKMDVGFDAAGKIKGVYDFNECIELLMSLPIVNGVGDSNIEVNLK